MNMILVIKPVAFRGIRCSRHFPDIYFLELGAIIQSHSSYTCLGDLYHDIMMTAVACHWSTIFLKLGLWRHAAQWPYVRVFSIILDESSL